MGKKKKKKNARAKAKKKAKARKKRKPMAKASITESVVWHYTTGAAFIQILEDGFIKPATAFIDPGERPAVHFSAEPVWEPTANKWGPGSGGFPLRLSKQEMYDKGGGLARFGLRRSRAVPWERFKKKSRMSAAMAAGLEATGLREGADPANWYAVFGIVPESDWEQIDVWDHGVWVQVYPTAKQETDSPKEADDAHHG